MLNTCDYTRVHKRGTHGYICCTRDLPNIYNICTCMVVSLDFNPSTSQANERVVFSAYHSMWIVEFSWTSFKVEMGFVQSILKHGRWAIRREKMGANNLWDLFYFIILRQLEEVMHEKMPCFNLRKKFFDQKNSPENEQKACVIHYQRNSRTELLTNSRAKMCKSQYASHLAFGVCKPSHIFNHVYAKNSFRIWEGLNLKSNNWCEHNGVF
jgi:hypothetical protein